MKTGYRKGQKALLRAAVIVAVWLFIAGVTVSQYYYYLESMGSTRPWLDIFIEEYPQFAVWAACTPLILWLSRRVALKGRAMLRFFGLHAAASVLFSILFNAVWFSVDMYLLGTTYTFQSLRSAITSVLFYQMYIHLLGYWAIVGIDQLLVAWRRSTALEIERSHLQQQLAESKLKFMQMQVQPHFLYNALHSIGLLAARGKNEEVGEMTEKLGALLRTTLELGDRTMVSLQKELDLAMQYLEIEKIRFGERLQLTCDTGDLGQSQVPALLLQPIVENSIRHGLYKSDGDFKLSISASSTDGLRRITVADTVGDGRRSQGKDQSDGFGLASLRKRLHILYGDKASVDFTLTTQSARTVITLPMESSSGRYQLD